MISNKIMVRYLVDTETWAAGEYRLVSPEIAKILAETGKAQIVGTSPRNKMVKE